jgi:DNA-binding transcriptional MerR regulator/methylmalonyl-CoA mutase cobalamin-binding subunit
MARRDIAPRYPIRAVARLTGVGIDTLRAWERRHGAVTPTRDERGRLYSDADVRRLRLLRDAVAHGHSIGRIAALDTAALESLGGPATEPGVAEPSQAPRDAIDRGPLIEALRRFDTAAVEAALGRAAVMLTPSELLRHVVVPVLTEIGDDWCKHRVSVAHEHLMSAVVRNVLGSFLHSYSRPQSGVRILFSTPEHERHEFGALGAALLAASAGLDALYLGPELPAAEIVDCATTAEADVVVLGVTAAAQGDAIRREVEEVARRLPKDVELWLGGPAAASIGAAVRPRALVLSDYEALEAQLARVAGA